MDGELDGTDAQLDGEAPPTGDVEATPTSDRQHLRDITNTSGGVMKHGADKQREPG